MLSALHRRRLERGRLNVLFLVGHMRSGSTLLVHILNTSPEILGYGETHRRYADNRDLARLAVNVGRSFGRFRVSERYVLDKILYDYIKRLQLLRSDRVRTVFLVRNPGQALPSIVHFRPRWGQGEAAALDYYRRQLRVVREYACAIDDPDRAFFVTYSQLINRTRPVLEGLRRFLELGDPLRERYRTIWSTGQRGERGIGDDSEEIRAGRIVRTRKAPPVTVSKETLRLGQSVFADCVAELRARCAHVGFPASRKTAVTR